MRDGVALLLPALALLGLALLKLQVSHDYFYGALSLSVSIFILSTLIFAGEYDRLSLGQVRSELLPLPQHAVDKICALVFAVPRVYGYAE